MIIGVVVGAVGVVGMIVPAADDSGTAPAAAAVPASGSVSTPVPSPVPGLVEGASPPAPRSTTRASVGEAETPAEGRKTPAQPASVAVPARGPGTYKRARLKLAAAKGRGRVVTFDVRVERGLALDPKAVAREIHATLSDKRSWRGTDHVRFRLVSDPAKAHLHAYVVTPGTTDRLCYPWRTRGQVSCQNGDRVVLNAKRWVFGAKAYKADVASYRQYLVNHEFGHSLGYNHVGCPGKGRPAPVMMQQTKGLKGCRPNPWPSVA